VSNEKNHHLVEDQIIQAVVDEGELSVFDRRHLNNCHHCRAQKMQLEQNLARLGQAARQYAPLPRKRLNLKAPLESHSVRRSWNWKTALGTALATAALIIFMLWANQGSETFVASNGETLTASGTRTSDSLMTEVGILSENALPPEYLDIAAETEPMMHEEFIDFIAPLIEDDSMTYLLLKKGVRIC
jgi:hypothetical protein